MELENNIISRLILLRHSVAEEAKSIEFFQKHLKGVLL
jgi:hypothetical protein